MSGIIKSNWNHIEEKRPNRFINSFYSKRVTGLFHLEKDNPASAENRHCLSYLAKMKAAIDPGFQWTSVSDHLVNQRDESVTTIGQWQTLIIFFKQLRAIGQYFFCDGVSPKEAFRRTKMHIRASGVWLRQVTSLSPSAEGHGYSVIFNRKYNTAIKMMLNTCK